MTADEPEANTYGSAFHAHHRDLPTACGRMCDVNKARTWVVRNPAHKNEITGAARTQQAWPGSPVRLLDMCCCLARPVCLPMACPAQRGTPLCGP